MNYLKLIQILTLALLLCSGFAYANENTNETIQAHVFVSETCPHCAQLETFLSSIEDDYPYLEINIYEISMNESNRELLEQMANQYDIEVRGVPTYFIGDKVFEGYSSSMNDDIISAITQNDNENRNSSNIIDIPFIGKTDATNSSLPLIAILLGFLDGFNPCAFFVLLFLLSMLVYARSKKRMLIVGLTFVFFSGLIYFLFMSAWLNFFMVTKNINYITTISGLVALIIAIINIKDFFAFKKGVSLSVSDKHRTNLASKMRGLLKAESLISMLIGTIILAITANLYELICTAGFPMVFTKILVLNELSTMSYYSYLLLYNIAYVIPLLTIVLFFSFTFKSKKLSQTQGEALKLLSGMMMLSLGIILVFFPKLLDNVVITVAVILLAILITGFMLSIKKYLQETRNLKNNKEDNEK
jgi:glutaredoxin